MESRQNRRKLGIGWGCCCCLIIPLIFTGLIPGIIVAVVFPNRIANSTNSTTTSTTSTTLPTSTTSTTLPTSTTSTTLPTSTTTLSTSTTTTDTSTTTTVSTTTPALLCNNGTLDTTYALETPDFLNSVVCFNLAQYSGVVSGLYLTLTDVQIREFQKSTGHIIDNYVFPGTTAEWPSSIYLTQGMWNSVDSGGNNYWTPLAVAPGSLKVFAIAKIFAGTALYYSNLIPNSDILRSQYDLVAANCNFGSSVYVVGARTWFNSTANDWPQTPFVLKFNASDGSLDTTFGINGRIPTGNELGMNAYPWPESVPAPPDGNSVVNIGFHLAVSTQSDGKIIGVGFSRNSSLFTLTVARYNTDGTFDNSFGSDGNAWFHYFDNSAYLRVSAVYIDPVDKIYITGAIAVDNLFVVRLTSGGLLDAVYTGFSAEGEGILNLCEPFDGSLAVLYTSYTGVDTPGVLALASDFTTVLWSFSAPANGYIASGIANGYGIIFNARNYSARLY